ncbi:MAG: hypothetical protein ACPGVG_08505 [Mycobacterium sp.]
MGRVGALAVILGVGAAIASLPAVVLADTGGSATSTGSSSSSSGPDSSGSQSGSDSSVSGPDASSDGLDAGTADSASNESVGDALQDSADSEVSAADTDIADAITGDLTDEDDVADEMADNLADEDGVAGEAADPDSDAASGADTDADAGQDSGSTDGGTQESSGPVDTSAPQSGSSGAGSESQYPAASPSALEADSPNPETDSPDPETEVSDIDGPVAAAPVAPVVVDNNDGASAPAVAVGDQADTTGVGAPIPVMTAAPQATAPEGVVGEVASWLGLSSEGSPEVPALAPLVWTAAAFARRDLGGENGGENKGTGTGTVVGQTGEPTDPESQAGDEVRTAPPVAAAVAVGSCGLNLICDALELFRTDITDGFADLASDVFKVFDPALEPLSPVIGAAGFTLLSATLLGDFETVPSSIQDLATDVDVLETLSSAIADTSALASLPTDLRTAVGNAAAYFVEQSFGDPAVADAMVPVFEAIPFPTNVVAVVEYIYDLFKDDFNFKQAFIDLIGEPLKDGLTSFLADSEVQQAFGTAATDAVDVLIGATTPPWATPTNPAAIGTYVGQLVATAALGETNPATASVGAIVGDAVDVILSGAGTDVADEVGSAIVTFLSQPGVSDALATDVLNLILEGLGGTPLSGGGALASAADVTASGAVEALLSDSALLQALDTAATGLVTGLAGDSAVQQLAKTEVTALVTGLLGDSPLAAPVGAAAGTAVQDLLANTEVGSGLGALVGSVLPDFLGQTGVVSALADAAGQLADAVVSGQDLSTALASVLAALESNTEVLAAAKVTIADVLNVVDTTLLSDPSVEQSLSTIVTTLITDLAANPTIQSYIGDEIGAPFSGAVVALLANPAVIGDLADVLGSSVGQFLAYPGFSTALTDTINEVADALIDGTDASTALQNALTSLQANTAFQGAVKAIIPTALNSILGNTAIDDALGTAAETLVIDLLKEYGITNEFLDTVAGSFVNATLEALLAQQPVVELIDDVVVDLLTGTPPSDLADVVFKAVLDRPTVQVALGVSIGYGVGALVGNDSLAGTVLRVAAGATAAVVIVVAAGIVNLYESLFGADGLFSAQPRAAVHAQRTGSSQVDIIEQTPVSGGTYTMEATVPDPLDPEAPLLGNIAAHRFVLTEMSMAGPEGRHPGAVDIAMTIETGDNDSSSSAPPPMQVAFNIPLDIPLDPARPAAREPMPSAVTETPTIRQAG